MEKLEFLKSIEAKNASICMSSQPVTFVEGNPSMFVTFPYPYMNGRLHLGHVYTIQKADMFARFYSLCGYNVLFPFAFHGSGMPIVSSAKKLERELNFAKSNGIEITLEYIKGLATNNQIKILYEMGIPADELDNFINPYHWIKYFSEKATQDVSMMNPLIDFTREFVTTNMNPYYDSFITWQFNHLISKGLVYKGIRNMIYSELDMQPCADHDRAVGEDVNPIKTNTFEYGTFLVTDARTSFPTSTEVIVCGKLDYVLIKVNNELQIVSKIAYNNIKHQYMVEFISNINYSELPFVVSDIPSWGTGIFLINSGQYERHQENTLTIKYNEIDFRVFSYYEPESKVVSRSGDICIVASTEQWFINYGDETLKNKVLQYVKNYFNLPTQSVKEAIEKAIEEMHERACSRNFGLGTKLPGTNDVIDSLSDSTIYMAYYTVAHLIKKIQIEQITHVVWDYIFLGVGEPFNEIVKECRKEFLRWYPVNIRVSGKDLVTSHLTYALFNHMAIWDSDDFMPRSYHVNGHLLMNGEKMSKSTGNFLTLFKAVEKYGSNAMRFALACNDGIDDGNFTDSNVNTAISKLANELIFIQDNIGYISNPNFNNVQQYEFFEHQIKETLKNAYNDYIKNTSSNIIKGFYAIIAIKDEYIKKSKHIEGNMIKLYCDAMYTLMTPICPTWAKEIEIIMRDNGIKVNVDWFVNYSNPNMVRYQFYSNVMKYVKDEINRNVIKLKKDKKNNVKIVVEVIRNFSDEELHIINNINDVQNFFMTIEDKRKMGQYKGFARHIENHIEEYGNMWLMWTNSSSLEEYQYVKTECEIIQNGYIIEVVSVDSKQDFQFKNNPGRPKVSIVLNV